MTIAPVDGVLGGPDPAAGAEPLAAHLARLGDLPRGGTEVIDSVERSGLRGRGGAGFPAATKWRSVRAAGRGDAVVLANGAEGEPLSAKDQVLMTCRPHLVLDGIVLATGSVGARRALLYVGAEHVAAQTAMRRALADRRDPIAIEVVSSPPRYVAGEETAAVAFVDRGIALPRALPPRPFERGVDGRPTLVQNVETLAHVALIARRGGDWFRSLGATAPGSLLVTLSGAVSAAGVLEVPMGTTVADLLDRGGAGGVRAVLLGGYFGTYADAAAIGGVALTHDELRAHGAALGCGVVHAVDQGTCGIAHAAAIIRYLAGESARQCGPCVFGLAAIAEAMESLAAGRCAPGTVERLQRWSDELAGRGACRHPDGAAQLVRSALHVFGADVRSHAVHGLCVEPRMASLAS